jgi:uncharacterized membrane protein YgcG
MKTRVWVGVAFIALVLGIPFFILTTVLVALDYTEARKKVAWKHFNSLEVPLAASGTHELDLLLSNLGRFKEGFAELKVSSEHKDVLERVERVSQDASALQERKPELDEGAYQDELARLRHTVSTIPRIGERTFLENNPWFSGLLAHAWSKCSLTLVASLIAFLMIFIPTAAIWCCSVDDSDKPNDSAGSGGGGGFGGGYGGCGGGYYGGSGSPYYGGYHPGQYISPTNHNPFGGGSNNGFPPWGSV